MQPSRSTLDEVSRQRSPKSRLRPPCLFPSRCFAVGRRQEPPPPAAMPRKPPRDTTAFTRLPSARAARLLWSWAGFAASLLRRNTRCPHRPAVRHLVVGQLVAADATGSRESSFAARGTVRRAPLQRTPDAARCSRADNFHPVKQLTPGPARGAKGVRRDPPRLTRRRALTTGRTGCAHSDRHGSAHACTPSSSRRRHAPAAPERCECRSRPEGAPWRTSDGMCGTRRAW